MKMILILVTLGCALWTPAQTPRGQINDRYRGYVAEVRQWLDKGEYERAEKTARFAIAFAQDNELSERPALTALGQALFRREQWAEAADAFVTSVRPGKLGSIDGMYSVACWRANRGTNATNAMHQHLSNLAKTHADELLGLPDRGAQAVEATGWLIIAMNEVGATGEVDAKVAVKLAPESVTAWWVLGQRQMETKKFKEAKSSFDKVAAGKIEGLAKKAKAKIKECDAALKDAKNKADGR